MPTSKDASTLKFSVYHKDSNKLSTLFSQCSDVLHSLSKIDYENLCALRYGDKSACSIDEYLDRIKSSFIFLAMYFEASLIGLGEIYPPNEDNFAEISYQVFPQYSGKGFGYKLSMELLKLGLNTKDLSGVFAECVVTNVPSLGLLEKLNKVHPASKIVTKHKYTPPTKIYYWLSSK